MQDRNFRRTFADVLFQHQTCMTCHPSFLRFLPMALCAMLCLSCTQDNVHMPDGGTETWETYTALYEGLMSTTVPLMEDHLENGPVRTRMTVQVEGFHVEHSGYVSVRTPPFVIDDPFVTGLLGEPIRIGEMRIGNVEYAAFPTGGGYLKKDAFEVQAGQYLTRGELHGQLSPTGRLTLTICYRPGAMPFEVRSDFDTAPEQ